MGLFVFCKQLVCLRLRPRAYLDQTFKLQRDSLSPLTVSPLPSHSPPLPLGVILAISFSFLFLCLLPFRMWKCFIGVVENNEDKAGLCGGRNAF